jgi:4,5-DOPA dioxygenase extradiol
MDRKKFLATLALAPLAGCVINNQSKKQIINMETTPNLPVLFLGHGSPMNAIEENEFVQGFRNIGNKISKPKAILCISAHWETRGTKVTAMDMPKTIHDFGGFPQALFDVQYKAPGAPAYAQTTKETITKTTVELDYNWGLDHGAWSVIKHMYPNADVPVYQMSIDYTKDAQYHYELGKELAALRKKGVLIVGSGNMIHNLGKVAWDKFNVYNYGYDWAIEAREKMNKSILDGNHQSLIDFRKAGTAMQLAIPTPEHYLPLLYILALQEKNENVAIFNDKYVAGSLSMTSVMIS